MKRYKTNIRNIMKEKYLDFSEEIAGRSYPLVGDGLKKVHRRILYSIYLEKIKSFTKVNNIIGVTTLYHEHGQASIEDALVRMGQDFTMRIPLLKGQGNFGSASGDSHAAAKYIEAKASPLFFDFMVDGIKEDAVRFIESYDGKRKEPSELPFKFCNLLINGSISIGVGLASYIPTHNPIEVIKATIALCENEDLSLDELMKIIPGPDFPSGCHYSPHNIKEIYKNGKGILKLIAKTKIDEKKNTILINGLPDKVTVSSFLSKLKIATEKHKELDNGIDQVIDASTTGVEIHIRCKKGIEPKIIRNLLFKYTNLVTGNSVNFVSITDFQKPSLIIPNLRELLNLFIDYRIDCIEKVLAYQIKHLKEKLFRLETIIKAHSKIEEIIRIVKISSSTKEIYDRFERKINFTKEMTSIVLDMKINSLSNLNIGKVKDDIKETSSSINEKSKILSDDDLLIDQVIIEQRKLLEILEKDVSNKRHSTPKLLEKINERSVVNNNDYYVIIDEEGLIKKVPLSSFKSQHRGGMGKKVSSNIIKKGNNRDYIFIFDNKGKVFMINLFDLPESKLSSKGKLVRNFITINPDEDFSIAEIIFVSFEDFQDKKQFFLMVSEKGKVKNVKFSEFKRIGKSAVIATFLSDDDQIRVVKHLESIEDKSILLITTDGKVVHVGMKENINFQKRTSHGKLSVKLSGENTILDAIVKENSSSDEFLAFVTNSGKGKLVDISDFEIKTTLRAKGKMGISLEDNESLILAKKVTKNDESLLVPNDSHIISVKIKDIPVYKRPAKGVRIFK